MFDQGNTGKQKDHNCCKCFVSCVITTPYVEITLGQVAPRAVLLFSVSRRTVLSNLRCEL